MILTFMLEELELEIPPKRIPKTMIPISQYFWAAQRSCTPKSIGQPAECWIKANVRRHDLGLNPTVENQHYHQIPH
jgi:hypothetical protein